jgi:hypothetical protein
MFLKSETCFFYVTRGGLSNHHEKRKKNSPEMFSCGHILYAVDT